MIAYKKLPKSDPAQEVQEEKIPAEADYWDAADSNKKEEPATKPLFFSGASSYKENK